MRGMSILRAALLAGLAVTASVSSALAADPFKVVAFAGASNWPFWVGQEKGFFQKNGLDVTLSITPNSVEMAKNLYAGAFDLALTSVDNVIAYDEGQGETELSGPADFVALFGVDNGLLHIMASPDIKTIADLKGKTLSVDAMTTGFAFVLRDALAKAGVAEKDVTWVRVGGGAQRLGALLEKKQDATLLNTPLDLTAEAKGFKRLQSSSEALGAYQGIVATTRRSAAAAKRTEIVAFTKGFKASIDWLADPANREEALGMLVKNMRGMERPAAELAYAKLLDAKTGIYRDLRIDREGMKTVLRLRSAYAEPKKNLTDPEKYIDESFRDAAMK
ncbi:MAG: ABC transporter substrate-binding protein [Beijerinckiaceae bacterium]|nr:ABC transporter substrate-binding protein [Beijerinckiaceae bacterium]MDO9441432.1 ABC transporter substrate-binding protein [Beijerinckiaceae bacterium]